MDLITHIIGALLIQPLKVCSIYKSFLRSLLYIAIIEGKDFPIYAWQFHPEKH